RWAAAAAPWRGWPARALGGVRGDSGGTVRDRLRAPPGAAAAAHPDRSAAPPIAAIIARAPVAGGRRGVSRPAVSVVMPFAGDGAAAARALDTLRALDVRPGDELILADNSGVASPRDGIVVVHADAERSPAHARNVGAEHAHADWILFLDADCRARSGLLDAYFVNPI